MAQALISLGSNHGDRAQHLRRALELLRDGTALELIAASAAHETRAAGGPANQGFYLNRCALVETALAPQALLARLMQVEGMLGRERFDRWGPRTIDLDLLLFDELVRVAPSRGPDAPGLVLPHPRMAWRRFVVEPAAEIAPQMRIPVLGWTLARLRRHLRETPQLMALSGSSPEARARVADAVARASGAQRLTTAPLPLKLAEPSADPAPAAAMPRARLLLEWLEGVARVAAAAGRESLGAPQGHDPQARDAGAGEARVLLRAADVPAFVLDCDWHDALVAARKALQARGAAERGRAQGGGERLNAAGEAAFEAAAQALASAVPQPRLVVQLAAGPQSSPDTGATWEGPILREGAAGLMDVETEAAAAMIAML